MSHPVPTIHLNGTSKERLLDDYCAALSALAKAREALIPTGPNMRDYYVQPDGAANHRIALDAHRRRIADLDAITREIMALGEAVADQCQPEEKP